MAVHVQWKKIAEAALSCSEMLLKEWLPNGTKQGGGWVSTNPTRHDANPGSFNVSITKGLWKDFASGDDHGADLTSLLAYLEYGGDQLLAAEAIVDRLNLTDCITRDRPASSERSPQPAKAPRAPVVPNPPSSTDKTKWEPILPVPPDAPPPHAAHPKRGRPAIRWAYRDAHGNVLGYVNRFVTSDGNKEVLPQTYCRHTGTGRRDWRWVSFPIPRPLYGLDALAARPDSPVLLVEGEKCRDAAASQLPEYVVVSWPNGTGSTHKVDWSPLAGRSVTAWPDADAQRKKTGELLDYDAQPGRRAMIDICTTLHGLGCSTAILQQPPPEQIVSGHVPEGWDVADAIAAGWTADELQAYITDHAKPWTPPGAEPVSADPAPLPPDTPEEGIQGAQDEPAEDQPAPPPDPEPAPLDAPLDAPPPPPDEPPPPAAPPPDMPDEEEEPDDDGQWQTGLIRNRDGEVTGCMHNVYLILRHAPQWRGVIAWDDFAQRPVKRRPPPIEGGTVGEWQATDDARTVIWLGSNWRISPTSATVTEAVDVLAKDQSFHPVQDWLNSLPPWDGIPRIDTWLHDYCRVNQNEYVRLVSRWYLIGMVARVMVPGSKFDTCLVMEGAQGESKSSAFKALGGEWFSDMEIDFGNKDTLSLIQGKWIIEIAELGALARSESHRQKSFLSRTSDEFRSPYARRMQLYQRQMVFGGTTNEWEWNKDPTGGRRFWPVEVTAETDIPGLTSARSALFAEALAAFRSGEQYWPTKSQKRELFDPEQLKREAPDLLMDRVAEFISKQIAPFSGYDVAAYLGIEPSKMTRDIQTRIGVMAKKSGCGKIERRTAANGVRYLYNPPPREVNDEKSEWHGVMADKQNDVGF